MYSGNSSYASRTISDLSSSKIRVKARLSVSKSSAVVDTLMKRDQERSNRLIAMRTEAT
jgi:hypothetical protein